MSDDLAAFTSKLDAMLARVEGEVQTIATRWLMKCGARVVLETMGPANQYPDTTYIAVGRLRAGYTWGVDAPASVPINRDRPQIDWDDFATATIARLDAEVEALQGAPELFLYNVVGYGWYVHFGEGTHSHIGPRPYITDFVVSGQPEALLTETAAEVVAGGVD